MEILDEHRRVDLQEIDSLELIDTYLNDYNNYLVILFEATWTGLSGYKFIDDKKEILYRGYDCTQYLKEVFYEKILILRETHHDCPCGHYTLIIGLNDKEYEYLIDKSTDFIIKYGKKYLENLGW